MKQEQSQFSDLLRLITEWKLNKVVLASKMPMPTPTFKNKMNPKQTAYNFTEPELERLYEIVRELSHDIEKVKGIESITLTRTGTGENTR